MKSDALYIAQILDSINKIELYSAGYSEAEYLADGKTQSALLLQLLLIGEIAKKISEETKSHIDLPWKHIIGFRDKVVHNYFDIHLMVVWNTIQHDIPALKRSLFEYRGK
jgi:uncharacterized protein with HEPN domain